MSGISTNFNYRGIEFHCCSGSQHPIASTHLNVPPPQRYVLRYFDDGVRGDVQVADFDPAKVDIVKKILGMDHYTIEDGGFAHNEKTGVNYLSVNVVVGQEDTWVPTAEGSYGELEKMELVTKEKDGYIPALDVLVSVTGRKTRGFLGFCQQEIYEAKRKETVAIKTCISVSAFGKINLDPTHLGNKDVQKALYTIIEKLFNRQFSLDLS